MLYGRVGTCTQEFGGLRGTFGRWRSRARGLPEFSGELPVATLAEEMATPGPGRIRALITVAGNPVLSTPNGIRLERALSELEFMVSIDPYRNETTRFAAAQGAGRSGGQDRGPQAAAGGVAGPVATHRTAPPSLSRLRKHPHGVDLGPLEPRLPRRLGPRRRINLAPREYPADLPRLRGRLRTSPPDLVLIGRRQLRGDNSWLHNSERLVKGRDAPASACRWRPRIRVPRSTT